MYVDAGRLRSIRPSIKMLTTAFFVLAALIRPSWYLLAYYLTLYVFLVLWSGTASHYIRFAAKVALLYTILAGAIAYGVAPKDTTSLTGRFWDLHQHYFQLREIISQLVGLGACAGDWLCFANHLALTTARARLPR